LSTNGLLKGTPVVLPDHPTKFTQLDAAIDDALRGGGFEE
jgi:hypothetical protein